MSVHGAARMGRDFFLNVDNGQTSKRLSKIEYIIFCQVLAYDR